MLTFIHFFVCVLALDSLSELVVQDAIDKVVAESKCTTIIIAHQLSTIRNADLIVAISDGRVVEIGTHDDLLASDKGYYRDHVLENMDDEASPSSSSKREAEKVTLLPELEQIHDAKSEISTRTHSEIPQFVLKDVSFVYPSRPDSLVLKGLNLSIPQGKTVALVGPR